jgi:hypothetical protein
VEILVAKLCSVFFSLFLLGIAHADEIKDAPLPEPNYVGIIIFLALMLGSGGWFMWKIMFGKNKDQSEK